MNTEQLTYIEKRTIFQILTVIMNADLVVRKPESDLLDHIFYDLGLEINEFDFTDNLDLEILAKDFSQFPISTKEYAKELFVKMASCDGYIDPRESAVINRICL